MPRELCASCSMALGRFLGHMKGIDSVRAEEDKIVIDYDKDKISKEELIKLSKESLQKLGHDLEI